MAESKKKDRYRNPANDLVDAAVGGTKKATRAAGSTAKKSVKAAQTAGSRTVKRQEQQEQQGLGLRGRRKRQEEKTKATKPTPKPTNNKPRVANIPPSEGTGGKAENALKYGSGAPKPSPKPSPSASNPPAPKPKPTATKPAGKVPSSNAGMKNQDKNFRGNPERKDSIASTLRELRGMGSGRKAAESKMSKPEDKSRYVAPDGRQYAGPAYGNGSKEQNGNNNSSTYTAQSDGAKKLQEAQKERAAKAKRDAEERAKKARERLTASASKKPGSTYG